MILLSLHGLNRWLAIVAGSWALGLLLPRLLGAKALGPLERRSLTVFVATVHAQLGLGLLLWLVLALGNTPPFEGRGATLFGHALGGVLAAVFVTAAVMLVKRSTGRAWIGWLTALFIGLALLVLGQTVIAAGLVVMAIVVGIVLRRVYPALGREATDRTPSLP
jgi:hypothetical protein